MITFKTLKYKNFLSVGDNEITIDFTKTKSTLIVGHNGSGKSLMLDALSFALFGKPHRPINKPQLINSINNKHCVVEVEFTIAKKEYRVIRGLKPNIFEIWVDGLMINQDSHTHDYQKLFETNILKLNHKSFHQVVVLGSSNFTPFMQLPGWTRRGVIEDLLDIGIFSKMNTGLKESQAKLKEEIKDTEYQIKLILEKIVMQQKHIDKLALISLDNAEQLNTTISDIKSQKEVLVDENKKLTASYQEQYTKAKTHHTKANEKIQTLEHYEKQIDAKLQTWTNKNLFYHENENCPSCNQHISDEIRQSKQHECEETLTELELGRKGLSNTLADARAEYKKTQGVLNELMEHNKTLTHNHALINNFETRLEELKKQKSQIVANPDISNAKAELITLREKKDLLSDTKSKQTEEQHYNEIIAELLKDTGIKTKIIRQYLPVMNKLINQYLQAMDFFALFNLDENFNETILSRHRDNFSYSSFSEGEKMRIDMALLFAWRQVAKMKNSANTNLLILDETFDSSLDPDGIDSLLRILSTVDPNTQIFVISHKQEILEGRFDRKIEFERRQNFTKIKSIG